MSLVCEISREHSGELIREDEGQDIATAPVPIVKGRTIAYVEGVEYLKATGFIIVACCHEIGSYLIQLRRRLANKMAMLSSWRTQWEKLKDFDRRAVQYLCMHDPRIDEKSYLMVVIKLVNIYHLK